MKMSIGGEWVSSPSAKPVSNPYTGQVIDSVPEATEDQIERTLESAVAGANVMHALTSAQRVEILNRAADLLEERIEDVAQTVSAEVGKPIVEARTETARSAELLRLSAFEGSQVRGETLPLEAQAGAVGKLGFTLRVPAGVVVAITPFNYPMLLVTHKIGPALATGNAVILKPASQTPLSALKFTEILHEAGLPAIGLQCITGPGAVLGPALCSDDRVRKISFTGSTEVGQAIAAVAGVKKLSLELGSNSPMIVLPDGDLSLAAEVAAAAGVVNAGQVCLSLQRLLVHRDIYTDFLDAFTAQMNAVSVEDPTAETTRLGPMISIREAERVDAWVNEAVGAGARLVSGQQREGARLSPTVVADVTPEMRIVKDEVFGPAVGVAPVADLDEALALANDSRYGLSASIFTRDINAALRFAREAEVGNIHVNWSPLWRADLMPYGGLKGSGIGKEGPRYAVTEMTDSKTVVFHGLDGS